MMKPSNKKWTKKTNNNFLFSNYWASEKFSNSLTETELLPDLLSEDSEKTTCNTEDTTEHSMEKIIPALDPLFVLRASLNLEENS